MALFSQRKGIRPLQKAIQRETIDQELRNRLWSALKLIVWDKYTPPDTIGFMPDDSYRVIHLVEAIWLHYFKKPVDTIPTFHSDHPRSGYDVLRDYFFKSQWWQVYDFLEFVAKAAESQWSGKLMSIANQFLEGENAAYRFVSGEVVEITDANEVAAIESAIDGTSRAAREHLGRALELLADRTQPDYRNSIKEAISAVESVCQVVAGKKGTLGECLKALKDRIILHPALEGAFSKLYGYTSDGGGIRHALTEGAETPTYADAKFMLVACSAFTGFLWTKAAESGLNLRDGG